MSEINAMALHKLQDENEALKKKLQKVILQNTFAQMKLILLEQSEMWDGWTPVSKRLPDEDGEYWVVIDHGEHGRMQIVRPFRSDIGFVGPLELVYSLDSKSKPRVTHWRELPPLPGVES